MYDRIGKYHVIRAAGAGGFGTVYEGYDLELDRNIAIKLCTSEDDKQLQRFRREARIVSKLKHPHIALVYDFGFDREAGVHYLIEEFLSGVDLQRKLEDRDHLPAAVRVRYLNELAQGLDFVHSRGLIHRDLSPRNVRILHDHTVKIMDFGLAKDLAEATLTGFGENFATIGYTAPEQITATREVDHRTDIFSFGVIAYALLTFSNPFTAKKMGEFIHLVCHHKPQPVRELWAECPQQLSDMIDRCMAKTPEERFGSFSEILQVLREVLSHLRDHDVPTLKEPAPFREILRSASSVEQMLLGSSSRLGDEDPSDETGFETRVDNPVYPSPSEPAEEAESFEDDPDLHDGTTLRL